MFASFFFMLRTAIAWGAVFMLLALFIFEGLARRGPPDGFLMMILMFVCAAAVAAFSHVRRVRLIDQTVNSTTLANRHRRVIDLPISADEAFELLQKAVTEFPGAQNVEAAANSLQVRAKIKRSPLYYPDLQSLHPSLRWLSSGDNQIYATVSPGVDSCAVTLICEPMRPTWTDFFILDQGSNLDNVQAFTRALMRRLGDMRSKEREEVKQTMTEKELSVAKLNLLHAQVEPHFLYNSLASAQLLTRSDPAKADEMLGNLITYLRHSLPRTEDSLSTIGEELERTRAYLDIMKIRMGSRLNVQYEIPDYLKPVLFPSMMLQTLVENAIKHGLEPKSGGGTIWVLARAHENMVAVTVADDGRGFSAESAGTGIGLRNVRERLRLAYGNTAQFSIVANFPNGVAATITVPTSFIKGEVS
ncbi:histidine kinase [Undibacterium cyanobacteriorum]|uniref:Histidine kinase n=1 Tax=Undibacterium cyanobacteriorum TaxID=3073561 RepID=A0ABY9RP28_9BURK|nr:histidine kinase [Undibacterium sp. 20NA77.5]WMW82449.1 histidine kinase [Undibacterium sp. 20NA77.5]